MPGWKILPSYEKVKHEKQRINWASEASPTLGCSIEISRDIYIYVVGMSRMSNHVESRESNTRMLKVSKIRPVTPILFVSSIR